jgi:hypothetical protein
MANRIIYEAITGQANKEIAGTGLTSLEKEKRTVKKLYLYVTGHAGNVVRVYLDTLKAIELIDYFIITDASSGSTNVQLNTNRVIELDVNYELAVGQKLLAAINCGGTAKDLHVGYAFDVAG